MAKYFIVEEPLCVNLGTAANPLAVREFRTLWRDVLRQGASVVALRLNADPAAKPVIAGVNVLMVTTAKDKSNNTSDCENPMQLQTEHNKKLLGMVRKLTKKVNPLKKYGVDKCLCGLGLSVHPSLRGQGLGEEIIRAREEIGLAYQIPMSETAFTATASQILAARAGYEVLLERNYSEIVDDGGKVVFPGLTVKSIKLMARRLY